MWDEEMHLRIRCMSVIGRCGYSRESTYNYTEVRIDWRILHAHACARGRTWTQFAVTTRSAMHTHIKRIYIREPTVHADNYARVWFPSLGYSNDASVMYVCTMEYVNGTVIHVSLRRISLGMFTTKPTMLSLEYWALWPCWCFPFWYYVGNIDVSIYINLHLLVAWFASIYIDLHKLPLIYYGVTFFLIVRSDIEILRSIE